MYLAH